MTEYLPENEDTVRAYEAQRVACAYSFPLHHFALVPYPYLARAATVEDLKEREIFMPFCLSMQIGYLKILRPFEPYFQPHIYWRFIFILSFCPIILKEKMQWQPIDYYLLFQVSLPSSLLP